MKSHQPPRSRAPLGVVIGLPRSLPILGLAPKMRCWTMGKYQGISTVEIQVSWLVVYLPLRKIWKSIGMTIPNIWENKKCSKPPTSYSLHEWIHSSWVPNALWYGNPVPVHFKHPLNGPKHAISSFHFHHGFWWPFQYEGMMRLCHIICIYIYIHIYIYIL